MTDELGERIREHIINIAQKVPRVSSARFIVNVEANPMYAASSVEKYLREHRLGMPNSLVMREDVRSRETATGIPEITAGTRTTNKNKIEMVHVVSQYLRNGRIRFYSDFVVSDATLAVLSKEFPHPRVTICREFKTLLRVVTYKKKNSTDELYSRPTIRYRAEKGEDRNDFFMALAINTLQHRIFMRSDKYTQYHVHRY